MKDRSITSAASGMRSSLEHDTGGRLLRGELWICDSLGGAAAEDRVWLARMRGFLLAAGALTLAASGLKVIGPLTISDLLLAAAVVLMLPRFEIRNARRMWVPLLAVTVITVGGIIGTAVASPSEVSRSGEMLGRFVVASAGATLLVICWRPGLEQIKSFGWLWVAGGVISALFALLEGSPRPSGLAPHSTHLAIVSLILLGVSIGLISSEPRWTRVLPGLLAAGALFAAVVASGSRAAFVGAVIIVLLALLATRKRIVVGCTIAAAVAGTAFAVITVAGGSPSWAPDWPEDTALERLFQAGTDPGPRREAVMDAAWDDFASNPLTGVGFADANEPHNLLLQLGSSAGVLGVIGALTLIALAIGAYLLAVRRRATDVEYWSMEAALSAAMIGYLVANSFQNVTWDRSVWLAIALVAWLAATARDRDRSDSLVDLTVDGSGRRTGPAGAAAQPVPVPAQLTGRSALPAETDPTRSRPIARTGSPPAGRPPIGRA